MGRHALAKVCTEPNKIGSTLYSDSYRAAFQIDDRCAEWQLTAVQLPFPQDKEDLFLKKTGLKPEELPTFYELMEMALDREISLQRTLIEKEDEELKKNILFYEMAIKHQGDVLEYYFVTEPTTSIIGSDFMKQNEISYGNLLTLGIRMCMCAKSVHKYGIYLNNIDIASLQICRGDRPMLKLGSLLYANRLTELSILLPMAPEYYSEDLANGNGASACSDAYMISAMLWSLANGYQINLMADLDTVPAGIPEDFVSSIRSIMIRCSMYMEEDPIRTLLNSLYELRKRHLRSETGDILIHLHEVPKQIRKDEEDKSEKEKEREGGLADDRAAQIESSEQPALAAVNIQEADPPTGEAEANTANDEQELPENPSDGEVAEYAEEDPLSAGHEAKELCQEAVEELSAAADMVEFPEAAESADAPQDDSSSQKEWTYIVQPIAFTEAEAELETVADSKQEESHQVEEPMAEPKTEDHPVDRIEPLEVDKEDDEQYSKEEMERMIAQLEQLKEAVKTPNIVVKTEMSSTPLISLGVVIIIIGLIASFLGYGPTPLKFTEKLEEIQAEFPSLPSF